MASLPLVALIAVSISSCDDDDEDILQPNLVKEWTIPLSALNENPAPAGRTETGTAKLQLYDDNTLKYEISVTGLASGDAITGGHLHSGNPVTNGPVILGLDPQFTGNTATGTVTIPRESLVDSIQGSNVYINLHTTQVASGLIRGQLDKTVEFVKDIELTGANEVPPVTTTTTGTALLRMTSDKMLFYRIDVNDVETGDAVTAAHIHTGAAGANGDVLKGLAASADDFGVEKSVQLEDAVYNAIKGTDALYVNVHSTNHPDGIIRGQIR